MGQPSNACSTLIASFALVSKYGIPPLDWQKVMARFDDIYKLYVNVFLVRTISYTYHSLILLYINLIAKHNLS